MKFINKKEPVQVRIKEKLGFKWECVRKGETIDLPEDLGLRYGFEKVKVTEGKIGKKKVETKQFEKKKTDYKRKLVLIKGISSKRAKDIIKVFPTEEDLLKAISHKERLPFRDDIEEKLSKEYGKQS